jgi:hypothetical protein
MFVVVTVGAIAVYVTMALVAVRDRTKAHRDYPIRATWSNPEDNAQPPLLWRWLGAETTHVVSLDPIATERDLVNLKRLFPEARVQVLKEGRP